MINRTEDIEKAGMRIFRVFASINMGVRMCMGDQSIRFWSQVKPYKPLLS